MKVYNLFITILRSLIAMFFAFSSATYAQDKADTFTPESAKVCVENSLSEIQKDPISMQKYVDVRYVRQQISKAFDVKAIFIFLNIQSVKVAVRDLITRIPLETADSIDISLILEAEHPSNGYTLLGQVGNIPIEVQARFYNKGVCKIMDARMGGTSILTLLIGRLGSEPAFAKRLGDQYY